MRPYSISHSVHKEFQILNWFLCLYGSEKGMMKQGLYRRLKMPKLRTSDSFYFIGMS